MKFDYEVRALWLKSKMKQWSEGEAAWYILSVNVNLSVILNNYNCFSLIKVIEI
jgi:hypothetical protein